MTGGELTLFGLGVVLVMLGILMSFDKERP
jgi:hypothetical protein